MSEQSSVGDPRLVELPTGDVTFLLSDIEGSTALFQRLGEPAYRAVLADHHRLIRAALVQHRGAEFGTEGDAFLVAFSSPRDAAAAALAAQSALGGHDWPPGVALRVRMGLHRGPAELGDGRDYVSLALHQAARVAATPHGGQVVASEPVASALVSSGVATRSLGSYWLKDFAEPIPLFAVGVEEESEDSRPLRAPRADLSNVPASRGPLFGRKEDLADLADELSHPGLVTLAGPGGVGKTRLAVEVAARCARAGQETWVVELAALSPEEAESGGVVASVARALGSSATAVDALIRHVGGAEMVLVLDNAEHVLGPAATTVDALVRGCPQLRVLVTSREPLGIDDEVVVRLAPLAVPDQEMTLVAAAATPAMRLFVARARATDRGFSLTTDNWQETAELCRALDGVPLAVELAAARAGSLGPAVLLRRLLAVGDIPGAPPRGKDARHSALHAVLDWSLSLCTPTEVAVLRRLGVFAGPVDADAVTEVAGGDGLTPYEVIDALSGLVDKSLVVVREGSEPRYDLLVTVRAAAAKRLQDAGELPEAQLRHARWVAGYVRAGVPVGHQPPLERLQAVFSELLVALERGAEGSLPTDLFLDLLTLDRLALIVRVPQLGIRYGGQVAASDLDVTSRARGQLLLASALDYVGSPAADAARFAVDLARESGEVDLVVHALCVMHGTVEGDTVGDNPEGGLALYELSTLLPQVTDPHLRGVACNQLGMGALARADLVSARRWYEQALDEWTGAARGYNLGVVHFNIAEIDEREGRIDAATLGYQAAVGIFREVGATAVCAFAATHLSGLLLTTGRYAEAAESAADAVLAARRARSEKALLAALNALAAAYDAAGDPQRAESARAEVAQLAA